MQTTVASCQCSSDVSKASHFTQSPNDSQSSFTDFCAFDACKEQLSHGNRPCSAAVSLRHMLDCVACPSDVCRVSFILKHMSNFVRAPQVALHTPHVTLHLWLMSLQVCHVDICCYCGTGMNTWSPDARTNHRKLCIISAKAKCDDPLLHSVTVDMLTRLWTVTYPTHTGSPTKRSRGEGDTSEPISPILAGRPVVHQGGNAAIAALNSPQLVADSFFHGDNDDGVRDFDEFHRNTVNVDPTWN